MRLGTRIGQKTLENESKWHPNTKVHSEPQGQFDTFGVPNGTLERPNFLDVGFGPTAFGDDYAYPFRSFHKRICPD